MDVAIYCDTGAKVLLKKDTRDLLMSVAALNTLHVNVEGSEGARLKVSKSQAREVAKVYGCRFRLRPVFWPKQYFNAGYVDTVRTYEDIFGEASVLDLEPNWRGANDGEDALLLSSFPDSRVTTHMGHELVRRPKTAAASRLAAELEVQALSTNKYPFDHRLGPGPRQRTAVSLGLATQGRKPFITLPLWNQKYEGRRPAEALEKAFVVCRNAEVPGVAYWSLKHLLRNEYAQRFLREDLPKLLLG